jgi:hypothetical protein
MGWELLAPVGFRARWDGGPLPEATAIRFEGPPSPLVGSRFGDGIVTVTPGWLFRTPRRTGLWVRGPVNAPKDGASPLEGVVETDWSPYTFTLNWKLTRPGLEVAFEAGEPLGHVVPVPRGALARFAPRIEPIAAEKDLHAQYLAWCASRAEAARRMAAGEAPPSISEVWDLGYLQGKDRRGRRARGHETRLGLAEFEERGAPSAQPSPSSSSSSSS